MNLAKRIYFSDDYFVTYGWLIITLATAFLQFFMLLLGNGYIIKPTFFTVFMTILLSLKRDMNGTSKINRQTKD